MPMKFRLRELREEFGLTQKQVGVLIGVKDSAVSKYERMEQQPDYESLIKLADYFDVSLDYLLGRTDERDKNASYTLAAHRVNGYDKPLSEDEKKMVESIIETYRKAKK